MWILPELARSSEGPVFTWIQKPAVENPILIFPSPLPHCLLVDKEFKLQEKVPWFHLSIQLKIKLKILNCFRWKLKLITLLIAIGQLILKLMNMWYSISSGVIFNMILFTFTFILNIYTIQTHLFSMEGSLVLRIEFHCKTVNNIFRR